MARRFTATYEDLITKIDNMNRSYNKVSDNIKAVEKRTEEINILKKHIQTYTALKPIYDEYRKVKNKD